MVICTICILAYLRQIWDVPSINSHLLQEENKDSEFGWEKKANHLNDPRPLCNYRLAGLGS